MKAISFVTLLVFASFSSADEDALETGFLDPPDSAKPWAYWWWLDSHVSKVGITADLEAMKRQGIAGALVFDAGKGGALAPDGAPFMSQEWREHLKFALEEAERLGMQISLNLCSGWNAGGPWVKPEHAARTWVWSENVIQGGKRVEHLLHPPRGIRENFYRDVAVLAFETSEREARAASKLTASSSYPEYPASLACDLDPETRWISNGDKPGQGPSLESPEFLQWTFPAGFPAASLVVNPYPDCGPKACELQYSEDGRTYQTISRFVVEERKKKTVVFDETTAGFFRLVFTSSYPYRGQEAWNVQISEVALLKKGQEPPSQTAHLKRGDAVDLTSSVDAKGKLVWDAPEGTWKILRMGTTLVDRGVVHCTSPGGGGLEIDPLSKKAMDIHFDATAGACLPEMGRFMGRTLKYTHIDSWELGVPTWTDDFRSEFKRRNGYDPWPYLPALAGKIVDSKEVSDRFLHDCRRTVADCVAENYYGRLSELSRKHGMGIHPEAGGPFFTHWIDALQCLGKSDIPMGEYWARQTEPSGACGYRNQFSRCDTVRQAASAAHAYGKKLVQAEAYTTMGPNWEKDPYMLKDIGDLAFCAGLNRNMLCFYVHQPDLNIKPGNQWEEAGTHFDRNITWFPLSNAWLKYLARCQFLMQQGQFVADVCYYYGENVPAFVPGRDHMKPALPHGYDCDTINSEVLLNRISARQGRIVLPGGMSYRVLVLPDTDSMSLTVLEKVVELAQAGIPVLGPRPTRTPGLRGYPSCDDGVKQLASRLDLVTGNNLQEILADLGIQPDFASGGVPLHYIHRRSDAADIYFVCNQQSQPVTARCSFRAAGKQPEIWDAVTGEVRNAAAFEVSDGRTTLQLEFPSRGSLFVVFRKPTKSVKGSGRSNFSKQKEVKALLGPWTVKFEPRWGGPESVVFEELVDWTQREEPGIRFYSGKATYYKTFDLNEAARGTETRLYLDLERVRNVAQVRLNGKDLGVVWTAPWRVEITRAVEATGNRLEIDVINLWPNRLIGDAGLPPEKRLTKTNVHKFYRGEHELLPSGLLGPVTLLADVPASAQSKYRDGRPEAKLRMEAKDHGIVLRFGDGPDRCDYLGARDAWVFEDRGTYYMHYDAAGPEGWLCSLATSNNLLNWEKKGPVLDLGKPGEDDSRSASYGVTYHDGQTWHMFYLGTPNVSPPPDLVPSFPYLTMKAKGANPTGPWFKQKDVVPFRTKPGSYYSITASPGQLVKSGDEYLQFFSATTRKPGNPYVQRTLGIARTKDLDGSWTVDPRPMVPIEEQIENSSLYYEKTIETWFVFTNHIGIDKGEYTDAIWAYWSKDLNTWDPANKAVVLDGRNCTWSTKCIGLPSVVRFGQRLALFYDAPGGDSTSHMSRHIGLAWLDLPLSVPGSQNQTKAVRNEDET